MSSCEIARNARKYGWGLRKQRRMCESCRVLSSKCSADAGKYHQHLGHCYECDPVCSQKLARLRQHELEMGTILV